MQAYRLLSVRWNMATTSLRNVVVRLKVTRRLAHWRLYLLAAATISVCLWLRLMRINDVTIVDDDDVALRASGSFYVAERRVVSAINCSALFAGKKSEISKALEYDKSHSEGRDFDVVRYFAGPHDCDRFRSRRGYPSRPLSDEENLFPLAFRCFDNVFVTAEQLDIIYGTITLVTAELNCMRDLLHFNKDWKYFINLASEEFPLKTNRELVKILKLYDGLNEIQQVNHVHIAKHTKYKHALLPCDRDTESPSAVCMTKTDQLKSAPPHDLVIFKGSRYGAFSRRFSDFVVHSAVSAAYVEWLQDTLIPDELFWGTLNRNQHIYPPGGSTGDRYINNSPIRAVIWEYESKGVKCGGKFVREVCVFGYADLPILYMTPYFFANKFYKNFQRLALDCLEELHVNRTLHLEPIDTEYYLRNLPK
ncbi:PREDICTED: N-acetyllactosaminide beta-1,6-N-acetylglucosaminyl-transferase, isoform B-like isoform X3 [Priapulus caudatus]|uniref:N-acetyllactosaminide beta-1,6-N-acetylglucosaminyl-transferase, isoform B-like isoform X3 n=1 Tax=Priapulus caudatus TaxID=37621 RepID=A0ABM1EVH3_PRICU|nr:PREDICTED: N-acetyllactosaminide beta-1,6-N-acetylglucosaminyl-transferase, isoform B-like isoform X3 [Priapulus caudatus]